MTDIKIETVEKNFDAILELVGNDSYVSWEGFSQNSSEVVQSIDALNRNMSIYRECQHRNFIQTSIYSLT